MIRSVAAASLLLASPTIAQSGIDGKTAETSTGRVGQRQTRAEGGFARQPLERIDTRIANRIQSRIRNRIDEFYDPKANTTSPFVVAGQQARADKKPARR